MPLEPEQLQLLFKKLLAGTATEQEKKTIAEYLQQKDPAISIELLLPHDEWVETKNDALPEGMRERVLTRILPAETSTPERELLPVSHKRMMLYRWLTGAAAALILLIAGRWFFEQRRSSGISRITVAAAQGELKSIFLPDSSKVYLNAGSEISFPTRFVAGERLVELNGEAFFEVTHDAAHPFVVQTGSMRTTVLGTTFNVQAYGNDNSMSVSVVTGKVKVESNDTASDKERMVLLTPGLRAVYGKSSKAFIVKEANTIAISGWKENKLVFEEASLEEICKILGRHYNVVFKAENPDILSCEYSATFDQLTLDESLEKLKLLGNVQFQQAGSIVSIKGKPCK
jgi:transmembrane sensor